MKTLKILSIALTLAFAAGCMSVAHNTTEQTTKSNDVYAVVVGMEYSRFAGDCPGAGIDSQRMQALISKYAANVSYFRDATATKANVSAALRNAIAKAGDGLVIFFYSGHGGSEPFPDTGKEELDGSDEYLCFYDTYMRDNEVWKIIRESKGRVFLVFDCCHSETMFRTPSFKVIAPLAWDHTLTEKYPFSMLCWSGCPDDTYSYGAATGGQLTNSLLRHFDESKTYSKLWEEIKADKILRRYENPQSTVIGSGFEGKRVLK